MNPCFDFSPFGVRPCGGCDPAELMRLCLAAQEMERRAAERAAGGK